MKLRDANVLVTGASSGIGTAIAQALGDTGCRLALSGRRIAALEEVAGEMERRGHRRPIVIPADLSVSGAAAELAAKAIAALGSVDVLVNNAALEGEGTC